MLVFLNSGILFLATATLIPILIYLFIIKKPKRVVFSSIRNIKASQKRQRSNIKFKNILLLIIRCLIILLSILALARPALRAPFFDRWSRHSQTSVAIILDTSYSMDYLVDTRTELEIGKEIIDRINNILTERDQVFLFTSDPQWNRLYSSPFYDNIPQHLLATIEITPQPQQMKDIIKEATQKLNSSHLPNKEILVITDFREQDYPEDNEIPVILLPTSSIVDRNNISVQNARIEEDFVQRRLERRISFDVVNHSDIAHQDVISQLYVNGRTISEKVTDLQPYQKKSESFSFVIDEPGWYRGYVMVRNERLPYDTRSYFSYYHPDEVSVAFITDKKNMPLALMSVLEIYTHNSQNIDLIHDHSINYDKYSKYQLVIFDASTTLTPRLRFVLDRLNNDKKGVLIINNKDLDDSWKGYYQEEYGVYVEKYHEESPVRVSYINRYHPILDIFTDDDVQSQEVSYYWESQLRGNSNTLLQADNIPLVVEQERNVVWLFDVSDVRNQIIIDPIFPVMAYRTFLYCSYSDAPSYTVGDRISLPMQKIVLPNNELFESNTSHFTLNDKGLYRKLLSDNEYKYLPVNIDYSPSDYTRMEAIDSESLITLEHDDWQDDILRNRTGFEIWKFLFLIVLILLGAEMLIVKKQEHNDS